MMEQFLHLGTVVFLEFQERVQTRHERADERYVDAEADFHSGEFEADFGEDGQRA